MELHAHTFVLLVSRTRSSSYGILLHDCLCVCTVYQTSKFTKFSFVLFFFSQFKIFRAQRDYAFGCTNVCVCVCRERDALKCMPN